MDTKSLNTHSQAAILMLLVALCAAQISCTTSGSEQHEQQAPLASQELVKVQTSTGKLVGTRQGLSNIAGHSVYKFLGVPYAKAPINELRFQRPVELESPAPDHIVEARKHAHTCAQFRHLTRFISPLLDVDHEHQISEDCLYLNIYVPDSIGAADESSHLVPNKQLPMVVWIPGEGFDFADARQFDGSYLADKTQSVVVTVQYRVGVFGFLHAPQLNITGNMGLHDQLMALRWLQKNAQSFGADPERVTLMGRFSGAMSISALVTAPNESLLKFKGQPLFQRAALLSGIAVDKWIIDPNQSNRVQELADQAIARNLCSPHQLKTNQCLQTLPTESLLHMSGYGWRLVVDNELIGTVSPVDAIKNNKVAPHLEAVLLGETAVEGTLCLYRYMIEDGLTNYASLLDKGRMNEDHLYEMINYDSQVYFGRNLSASGSVLATLEALLADVEEPREKYLNACSQYLVKSHLSKFKRNLISANYQSTNRMNLQKRTVDVFHYELKYKPSFSLAPDYIRQAAHGDDVPLIFGLIYQQPSRDIDQRDLLMTRKMMAYVGNFVHGNNPLLARQSSSPHSTRESNNSDTVSMDESESPEISGFSSLVVAKRTWSTEDQLDIIDLSSTDLKHLNRLINYTTQRSAESDNSNQRLVLGNGRLGRQNIQFFVTDNSNTNNEELNEPANNQLTLDVHAANQEAYSTRSERLIELHRRQLLTGGPGSDLELLIPQRRVVAQLQSQQQQQQQSLRPHVVGSINESALITVLVFSSGVTIMALFSICLALCIIIFRYKQLSQGKQPNPTHNGTRFSESSSSYNICGDSRGSSIEPAVVQKKNGLSNVFAKLRNPNNHLAPAPTSVQCHSTDIVSVSQAFKCPAHPQNSNSLAHRDNIEPDELQTSAPRAAN